MKFLAAITTIIKLLVVAENKIALDVFIDSVSLMVNPNMFHAILEDNLEQLQIDNPVEFDVLQESIATFNENNISQPMVDRVLFYQEEDLRHLLLDQGYEEGKDFRLPDREPIQISSEVYEYLKEHNYMKSSLTVEIINA